MSHKLFPTLYTDSAYRIDYEQLYADGYRGIIYDIDNTLVTHGAPANARARRLFARLKRIGFSCCLLSNNHEPRVKMFNDAVHVQYICNAHKPSPQSYRAAMKNMGTDEKNTIFIGDQIFTDIYGANRAGIPSIMVRYIWWKEEIQIFLKRRLEFFVLAAYRAYVKRQDPNDPNSAAAWKKRYVLPAENEKS